MLCDETDITGRVYYIIVLFDNTPVTKLARHQLSRSHNSVIFTRVDTQDYVSDTCDSVSILTVVG